jgi:hypothetical protein
LSLRSLLEKKLRMCDTALLCDQSAPCPYEPPRTLAAPLARGRACLRHSKHKHNQPRISSLASTFACSSTQPAPTEQRVPDEGYKPLRLGDTMANPSNEARSPMACPSAQASSIACAVPCEKMGVAMCAASPASVTRPWPHSRHASGMRKNWPAGCQRGVVAWTPIVGKPVLTPGPAIIHSCHRNRATRCGTQQPIRTMLRDGEGIRSFNQAPDL